MSNKPRQRRSLLRTLNKSIFLTHLCVLTLSLLLSLALLLSISRSQYVKQSQASMDLLVWQMESISENLITIRNNLLMDQSFRDYLATPRDQSAADTNLQNYVNKQLSSMVFYNPYIDSFTIYQGLSTVLNVSSSNRIHSQLNRTSMVLQQMPEYAEISKSKITWGGVRKYTELLPSYYVHYYAYANGGNTIIPLLLSLGVIAPDAENSVLAVNVSSEYLQMIFDQNVPPGCFASLYDQNGQLLFTNSTEHTPRKWDSMIERSLNHSNWNMQITIPFSVFFTSVRALLATSFAISLCSSLLVTLVSSLIGHKLLNPFQDIVSQMDEIHSENLEKRLLPQEYEELDNLTDHFNSLMDRVQQLIRLSHSDAEEKRVLEMQALQSQINPHFIYNSLTTIRWMASMARAENVCQALLALSNVLRPIFSNSGTFWKLSSEQNFLENYCSIMAYRIGYKTALTFEFPESFSEMDVPRFILQPIVENSLIHGLSTIYDESARSIQISAARNMQYLDIFVTDNGKGISPEKRQQLNDDFQESSPLHTTAGQNRSSIGLYNVNRRIRLQYGENCGLCVMPTEGPGAVIRVRLLQTAPSGHPQD